MQNMKSEQKKRNKLNLRDLVVLSIFGAMMFSSKIVMGFLPNIHLIGALIIIVTVVYRAKALYSIYIFVFLTGIFQFGMWWYAYLYIWTILWGMVMLLPKSMPKKISVPVYMIVCGLHGLLFGVFYAPFQALMFGLDFKGMIAWIVAGFPFDITHCISNVCCGLLIVPMIEVMKKLLVRQKKVDYTF